MSARDAVEAPVRAPAKSRSKSKAKGRAAKPARSERGVDFTAYLLNGLKWGGGTLLVYVLLGLVLLFLLENQPSSFIYVSF